MTGNFSKTLRFPAGLRQPEGSARFSLDALLLGAYAAKNALLKANHEAFLAVEPGCGCGAALLGFALLTPNARCLGIDRENSLVESARINSEILALDGRCEFYQADLGQLASPFGEIFGKAALVLANPPWRKAGEGILCASPLRQKAHWASEDTLGLFLKAAEKFLMRRGRFCLILPPARLGDFFNALAKTRLGLRQLLPVSPFGDAPANRVLILCQKDAANDFKLEAPLAIHEKTGNHGQTIYTPQAAAFCPWLHNQA